jgi:hypothetical protein
VIGGFFGVNGKNCKDNIKTSLVLLVLGNREHAHQWIIYPEI